ncbi:sulfotransferase family protein [Leptolyngbya cf. ectocarpi LEGE 11479]|uniref:Sulfotransferase family protein n=1 Tax=Leptolyngbya cf. ectocarpi LEGE 11479 TaxID=1828722 RepID=A0A929FAF4_LEPEC|nr:sulfotransferase family protein [Leptolyngbya cf. ectocarpi LEGE 11479]
MLSEVNPHLSVLAVEKQAIDWLGLISKEEYASFTRKSYVEKIEHLSQLARATDKKLIIRDWISVNYLPNVAVGAFPSETREQELYLNKYGLQSSGIVFSRRAETVLSSIKRTFTHFSGLSTDDFASAYLSYAEAVSDLPIFHYEDFCENPSSVLQKICSTLNIFYDSSFIEKFYTFHQCTGDNNPGQESKRYHLNMISSSIKIDAEFIEYSQNKKIQKANSLLGYE